MSNLNHAERIENAAGAALVELQRAIYYQTDSTRPGAMLGRLQQGVYAAAVILEGALEGVAQ